MVLKFKYKYMVYKLNMLNIMENTICEISQSILYRLRQGYVRWNRINKTSRMIIKILVGGAISIARFTLFCHIKFLHSVMQILLYSNNLYINRCVFLI